MLAQQAPQDARDLDEIVVVGVTPVPGFKLDKDKVPGNIQTLGSSDLTRNGAASMLGALNQQVSGVNFNDMDALTDFFVGNARRLGTAGKILFPIPN